MYNLIQIRIICWIYVELQDRAIRQQGRLSYTEVLRYQSKWKTFLLICIERGKKVKVNPGGKPKANFRISIRQDLNMPKSSLVPKYFKWTLLGIQALSLRLRMGA